MDCSDAVSECEGEDKEYAKWDDDEAWHAFEADLGLVNGASLESPEFDEAGPESDHSVSDSADEDESAPQDRKHWMWTRTRSYVQTEPGNQISGTIAMDQVAVSLRILNTPDDRRDTIDGQRINVVSGHGRI
ncbi:hypothetical protein DPSP01_012281 [Paraphaeosphaeria sporulosa]